MWQDVCGRRQLINGGKTTLAFWEVKNNIIRLNMNFSRCLQSWNWARIHELVLWLILEELM